MPRCFISSIRQYKIGNKKGTKTTKTYDVMITRSGLAIQTMALRTCTRRPPRTSRPPKPKRVSSLKASLSQKSLHHLPLVTRFQLLEREHRIRNSGMDIGIREFIADEKRFEEDMEIDTIAETNKCTYPVVYDHSNGDKQICYKLEEGERLDVFKPSGTNQSSTALYSENEVKYGSEALVLPNSKVIMLTQGNGKGSIMQNSKDGKKPTVIRIVSAKSSRSGYQHEYRKQANPAIVWKRVNGAVVLQVVPQQAVQKPQKHKAYPAANTLLNMAREVSGASCVEDSNKSESDIGSVPSSPGSSICADSLSDDEDDQAASEYQYSCMVDGNGTKIYNCLLCDKIFTLFAAFQAHAATHTRQRNRCPVCKKMFSRSWLLKGHMRTHTGERPYTCPHKGCDRSFADKSNLRSHILIHTVTAKNYICDNCGRAFAQKRYLHKHRLEVCKS